jgi:hypothetical protein
MRGVLIGLAWFLIAPAAWADTSDRTLDIAVGATNTLVLVNGDRLRGQWVAPGGTYRIALTLQGVRLGAAIGFFGVLATPAGYQGPMWGVPIELSAGYAFGSAGGPRPYIDVRASATHVFAPMEREMVTDWAFSIMPRIGVHIPLGDYLFCDFAVGAGAGAERVQFAWAFGMSLPTKNL